MSKTALSGRGLGTIFVIGLVAGVAGSLAKLIGEAIIPPRRPGEQPPPALMAAKLLNRDLSKRESSVITQAIHWSFGSILGGVYAVLAAKYPRVSRGWGVPFGWVVMLTTHETTLPAFDLSPAPWDQDLKEIASELITHAMYGAATEAVRRMLSNIE